MGDATYNDTGNAFCGVAASLQVLGDNREHTGRQRHVEQTVRLFAPLLEVFQVLVQVQERVVLVVLAGDICAELAEVLQHLLHIFGRGLDVRLDSAQVLLVVHLRSGIADDLDVLGQELIAILGVWVSFLTSDLRFRRYLLTSPNKAGNYRQLVLLSMQYARGGSIGSPSSSSPNLRMLRGPR